MTESVTDEPGRTRDDSAPRTPETRATPQAPEAPQAPEHPAPPEVPAPAAPPAETAEAGTAAAPAPLRAPRRPSSPLLRAAGRWTAAVAAFGVFCAGTAYGITRLERHEVPGLATESDGRWKYPELSLPALPSGSPRPFAPGNRAQVHHADLRDLLIPAPEGAEEDKGLPALKGGWVPVEDYTGLYGEEDGEKLRQRLVDDAVRHIAARGWTMPDGTRTSVHLLRFNTGAVADDFHVQNLHQGIVPGTPLVEAPESELDADWPSDARPENVFVYAYDEKKPRGDTHTRHAYLLAGDTVALVVQSRKGTAPAVPFRQTVILQAQLLG
ncbi:hypothetical protein GCM10010420_07920 [Streptomyces glaucosporus]|uniref:Uncharacterized protein n=1 Tax=Streptomyces glaucosporus TaxID=284044 RepID=A0ABN3HUI8_9ACTN